MSEQNLRGEISMLGEMLGNVIRQLHGPESLRLIERIRRFSRDARAGDDVSADSLNQTLVDLSLEEMRLVIRAFSVFLDLTNLAEDRERIRVLQERTRASHPLPRGESVRDAVRSLQQAGVTAEQAQSLVDRLDIELVLTAHPTEAKRRSLRSKLSSIRELLYELDRDNPLVERRLIEARLRSEVVKFWQTDFMRPWRPSVLQEVERGLAVAPTLWDAVPAVMDDLRAALAEFFPSTSFNVTPFLRYGSWIGGDRDGHPYVTVDVSRQTLQLLRDTALDFHIWACESMADSLSMSQRQSSVGDELLSRVNVAQSSWPELADSLGAVAPNEIYRRHLQVVHWRLLKTREVRLDKGLPNGAYRSSAELQDDIEVMIRSLNPSATRDISEREVEPWRDQVATFGFHFARLDVRQDSGVHTQVMTELLAKAGISEDFSALEEADRQRVLLDSLGQPLGWDEAELSDMVRETLSLFRLLRRTGRRFGMEALGGHVISMTRVPSDLLTVLWLWEWSAGVDGGDPADDELHLPVVPLYETVDDLAAAAKTTDALLKVKEYRAQVTALGDHQMIMVGYSDSAKDGGYLAACWALYQAQHEIFDITEAHGVRLTLFHGRGGSLGRGGGPAARGIGSLPSRTFQGALRLTEQGEVLAERYDDPQIAARHLEQLVWSAIRAAAKESDDADEAWFDIMQTLAARSRVAYRHLVDHEGFVDFFRRVTPIPEIERLPIGSRPSRRKKGGQGLKDLRAIPWVFSWTQVRSLVPAWFGIGTALTELTEKDPQLLVQLQRMYRVWPFAQAWVDNAALAMSKTDLTVFRRYAELADDDALMETIANEIEREHASTHEALCRIVDHDELLSGATWLSESIRFRNRYVDPLNLIQVELLRRMQDEELSDELFIELQHLIRLSIKGIATGMRTTG